MPLGGLGSDLRSYLVNQCGVDGGGLTPRWHRKRDQFRCIFELSQRDMAAIGRV